MRRIVEESQAKEEQSVIQEEEAEQPITFEVDQRATRRPNSIFESRMINISNDMDYKVTME